MAKFPEYTEIGMISPVRMDIITKTIFSRFDDLGEEQRKQKWLYPRRDITVKYNFISKADMETLWEFYLARAGAFNAFSFFMPEPEGTPPSYIGEYVGTGDGTTDIFNLPCKLSTGRTVYVAGLVQSDEGASNPDYNFTPVGGADGADKIDFSDSGMAIPANGQVITLDFTGTLKIRSRFAEDKMTMDAFFDRVARASLKLKGLLNA